MGSKPKAPAPINVQQVAGEQKTQNTANLGQQQAYNRPDQQNQFGSTLQWRQTGTDANGNPTFEQTQSLGGTGQQFASGFSGLGQKYIDAANARPEDLNSTGAFDRAQQLWESTNAPILQRQQDALDTKLKNQGFTADSEGYKNAMGDLAKQQGDTRNSAELSWQNSIFNQGLQNRAEQLGELNPGVNYGNQAITGGFQGTNNLGVPNVDLTSLYNAQQQQAQQNYQNQLQSYNGMLGGIAGLGGTIIGSALGGPIGASLGGSLGSSLGGGGATFSGTLAKPGELPWLTKTGSGGAP